LAHAGSEEVAKPKFESRPGVEYKFLAVGIQSRRFSWLQRSEGSSKLLRPKGFRDTMTLRCWNPPYVGQLLLDKPGGLATASPVCPFFMSCESMKFAETGHRRKECPDLPVSLLMVLHALYLECEKSMKLTASSHHSCFFCSSRYSRDEVALSESTPTGARVKERQRVSHSWSQHST